MYGIHGIISLATFKKEDCSGGEGGKSIHGEVRNDTRCEKKGVTDFAINPPEADTKERRKIWKFLTTEYTENTER